MRVLGGGGPGTPGLHDGETGHEGGAEACCQPVFLPPGAATCAGGGFRETKHHQAGRSRPPPWPRRAGSPSAEGMRCTVPRVMPGLRFENSVEGEEGGGMEPPAGCPQCSVARSWTAVDVFCSFSDSS